MRDLFLFSCCASFIASSAYATHLPLSGRTVSSTSSILRRAPVSGTTNVRDLSNMVYTVYAQLGGKTLQLSIDTGSSDLWTNKEIANATDQHLNGTINYAVGEATGQVLSSALEFSGYTVPDQYFVYAPEGKVSAGDGVLGLGPSQDSRIRALRNTPAANPPIDRIFLLDNSTDNYIAVLLGRDDEVSSSDASYPFSSSASSPDMSNTTASAGEAASTPEYPGDLSICSVLPRYASVRNQPKLSVTQVPKRVYNGQHWQVLLDRNGIKGTDGEQIQISTAVTGAARGQSATVIFDTGYTFPQMPDYVTDALYKNVQGAKLEYVAASAGNAWSLPCDAELSASFYFGGVEYPIHPLDLNFQAEDGSCFGGFQPYTVDPDKVDAGIVGYDMILGMAFLRNVYMLVDFGSYTDVSTPDDGASFIQLLPLTNSSEASEEFRSVRGSGGTRGTSSVNRNSLGISDAMPSLPTWAIAVISVAVVLALFGIVATAYFFLCGRSQRAKERTTPFGAFEPYNSDVYRPLRRGGPVPEASLGGGTGFGGGSGGHMGPGNGQRVLNGLQPVYSEQRYETAWHAGY